MGEARAVRIRAVVRRSRAPRGNNNMQSREEREGDGRGGEEDGDVVASDFAIGNNAANDNDERCTKRC